MDISEHGQVEDALIDPSSVQWVKNNIKAFQGPEKVIETNGFGECRFVGATRKAKAKVIYTVCWEISK